MSYLTTIAPTTDSIVCDVDQTLYPHLFLIPAGIIITILAFFRRRKSFKTDVWGGRPGLVIPIDFLAVDSDRIGIVCVFGAATGMILDVIIQFGNEGNAWETAFRSVGITIEVAFLYYPYFACLASYHRIIGAMMGLPYAAIFFSMALASNFQKCSNNTTGYDYAINVLPEIPMMLCQLFIMGKFVLVLYQEIKDYGTCALPFLTREDEQSVRVKLTKPWLVGHVHNLMNKRPSRVYAGIGFYLRKIYNPKENFKFSTQTLSVVMVCLVLLYTFTVGFAIIANLFIEGFRKNAENSQTSQEKRMWNIACGFTGCFVAALILAWIFCMISVIRFMENHKNNMLRMFKGDKSFIPKKLTVSQFMIGKGLRYHSFQIGYFLWGYFLLLMLFFVICSAFYSLFTFSIVLALIVGFLKGTGVVAGVAILTGLSLPLASMTIFRDYSYPKDVISINNRNVYLVFSYFWFFVGLPMGFFSAISRILKAMAVGVVMLPRIDHSIMPDGFQQIDRGFNAYICYLHVQTAYRNPVLRVFCQILCDETRNNTRNKWAYSAQARNRWFLALTLLRNPQLASDRKHGMQDLTASVHAGGKVNHGDVNIEVDHIGFSRSLSDSRTGLIQDK